MHWLPRTGDRMVLLSPGGRPLTVWRIAECSPVPGSHLETFTLAVVRDGDAGPGDHEQGSRTGETG